MKNLNLEINSEELETCAQEMIEVKHKINQIFKRIDQLIDEVHDTDCWQGDTCEAFYERYLQLKEYFPKINIGIENFSKFLNTTSSNYKKAEKTIGSNIDSNKEKLNVNS